MDNEPQRQPPTYTPPSILPQVMRPTNNGMTPDQPPPIIPLGQPVLDRDGQPIQIQHGTITRSTTGEAAPTLVPVVIGIQMGPSAATMSCPSCQEEITTKTVLKSNTSTLTLAALFGCFCLWPCVCLTLSLECCRNTDHHCPKCQAYIGSYVR